jgi:phosphoglycolate phosphatase
MCGLVGAGDPHLIEAAVDTYRQHHASILLSKARPYPRITEAIEGLRDAGLALYVCTSKLEQVARDVLDHLHLASRFLAVHGSDWEGRATKTELLLGLLGSERLGPVTSVMVGDREYDILAARAVGVRSCAVTYGYGSRAELDAASPDWLCESPDEIHDQLVSRKEPERIA